MASPHSAYPYIVYPPYFQYPQPGSSSPRRPQNRSPHPLYQPPYPLQHGRQQQQQHYPPFNHHPHQHPQYYHQPQHQHQHQQWQPPQPQPLLPVTPTDLENQKDVDPPPIPSAPSPTPPTPTPIEVTKNVYTITGTIPISTFSSSSSSSHASPAIQSSLLSPPDEKSSSPNSISTPQQKEPQPQLQTHLQPPTHKPKSSWAIWSRRPTDPSNAPAIIISPQAHPPPDVVQQALDVRTPPPSPPPLPSVTLPIVDDEDMASIEAKGNLAEEEKHEENGNESESENGMPQVAAAVATDSSTVPSSATSVIDNSTSSTVPGSPATSTTSVSLPAAAGNGTIPLKGDEDEKTTAQEAGTALIAPASTTAAAPATASTSTSTTETTTTATTTTTSPSSAPPKKSWASLLKSSDSSSSASGSGRNALPTSNVVGISIPASTPNHQYAFGEPSSSGTPHEKTKADLIALLSSGGSLPAAVAASASTTTTTTTTTTTIRPRGLVNSGNMCFANAVLQMLVYTPPFQKLFVELGKLKAAKDEKKGSEKTPLVEAMIEFVKEFVVDDVRLTNGHGLTNGWGGGKGKEKEKERQWEDSNLDGGEDEGMWGGESFIPTYVYDALKEKKRFDNMRVSFLAEDDENSILIGISTGWSARRCGRVLRFPVGDAGRGTGTVARRGDRSSAYASSSLWAY